MRLSAFSAGVDGDSTHVDGDATHDGTSFTAEIAAKAEIEASPDGWELLAGSEQVQRPIQRTADSSAVVTNSAASDRAAVASAVISAALSTLFGSGVSFTREAADVTLAAIHVAIAAALSAQPPRCRPAVHED